MICPKCGEVLPEGSRFCPKCGAQLTETVEAEPVKDFAKAEEPVREVNSTNDTLILIAKILMLIGTIGLGFLLIPLIWCVPMTVHVFRCHSQKRPIGVGFKVCVLLFVSLISGVLLLCAQDE